MTFHQTLCRPPQKHPPLFYSKPQRIGSETSQNYFYDGNSNSSAFAFIFLQFRYNFYIFITSYLQLQDSQKKMDFLYHEFLQQKVNWIKEKGLWVVILIMITITISGFAFFSSSLTLFLIQPQQYKAVQYPEFQTKSNDDYKLVSVLENPFLKAQFCMIEGFTYTGFNMNQEQYCNFNYQELPAMNKPYDLILYGLNSIYVRYAKVCLLKYPYKYKPKPKEESQGNQTLTTEENSYLRNRYVCQKYRAYSKLHLIHDLKIDELIFLEIQLELSEKGHESLQFLNLRLQFEEDRSKGMRLLIDHYYWIAGIASLGMAAWIAIISTIVGIAVIVKMILNEKQKRQEQLIQKLQRQSHQQRQFLMKLKRQKKAQRLQEKDGSDVIDSRLQKQKYE